MLDLTPKFQRREVWGLPAKSYFIDTLLRGMTVPPLYLRVTQNASKSQIVREVVDGQQRIRSVLAFVDTDKGFRLAKTLKAQWAGKRFIQLSQSDQSAIMSFGFTTEIFQGISDQQILEVFCRLNMNGVLLNKQELRNGRYFGFFKHLAYSLAHRYLEFWRRNKIFTEQNIARMIEVELISELLIAGNVGMQDKKDTINTYYDKWEDDYPEDIRDEKRLTETIDTISSVFEDELADTEFNRPPLLYTLYCVVYHHLYGLPGITRSTARKKLSADNKESLKDAVIRLSTVIAQARDPIYKVPVKHAAFVAACQRKTDNPHTRKTRFSSLYGEAF